MSTPSYIQAEPNTTGPVFASMPELLDALNLARCSRIVAEQEREPLTHRIDALVSAEARLVGWIAERGLAA